MLVTEALLFLFMTPKPSPGLVLMSRELSWVELELARGRLCVCVWGRHWCWELGFGGFWLERVCVKSFGFL